MHRLIPFDCPPSPWVRGYEAGPRDVPNFRTSRYFKIRLHYGYREEKRRNRRQFVRIFTRTLPRRQPHPPAVMAVIVPNGTDRRAQNGGMHE